jgi:hypothetical protein
VSSSTILRHLRNSLDLKPYHSRWVPSERACDSKEKTAVMCREFLELLQTEEPFGFTRVVTRDESWLYRRYPHPHMWSVSNDGQSFRVDEMIASEKHMLTVLWSIEAPVVIEWLGPGDKFHTISFCDVMIAKLVQALCPGGAFPTRPNFSLQMDNARLHNSAGASEFTNGKSDPIIPLAISAGCGTIRLLSVGTPEDRHWLLNNLDRLRRQNRC